MEKKYLLVTAVNEPNIGVIEIENPADVTTSILRRSIWDKLELALCEHFDETANVLSMEIDFGHSPMQIEAKVDIDDITYDIFLNETWVY